VAALVAGTAFADTPRMDLGVGIWQHDTEGTLSSDDPLLAVPPGFELGTEKETYERFSVRLGSAWWAPVLRARHAELTARGRTFVDNSTPPLLVDTTETRRELDFEQLEGLLYFTLGETLRGEFGGGVRQIDGSIHVVETRDTTLGGTTVTEARRDLPLDLTVLYGGLYAEPASWLSFGGEAVGSAGGDADLLDVSARFVVKPLTWMGVEGGYRLLTLAAQDGSTDYDFEFRGIYAGLSFLYGSKNAGLFDPDGDHDGVVDSKDRCKQSTPGVPVDASGCEPDRDGDRVPDGRDDCLATPKGAVVDASGCHKDTDGDAVADGVDECPNTPAGVAVNPQGCTVDADGDGVADSADQCPDSPAGIEVDRSGCPRAPDADSDGVPDLADRCPGGAAGAVDASGCPLEGAPAVMQAPPPDLLADEDRDGVADGRDRCRRTPRGLKVDATGCATRTQATVLQGITFQKNSSYLMRDSEVLLLDVVAALQSQRTMKVEIQGHTCDLGDGKYNKWLSQRRANRVLEFLVRHGIDAARLSAVGHGEVQPLVPNDDERMRELNRRTVFVVVEQ
jgi:outer membrane protein OmpA-like peptidoglycan-associated protein